MLISDLQMGGSGVRVQDFRALDARAGRSTVEADRDVAGFSYSSERHLHPVV